jgi:hypothetical protein
VGTALKSWLFKYGVPTRSSGIHFAGWRWTSWTESVTNSAMDTTAN